MDKSGRTSDDEAELDSKHELAKIETSFGGPISSFLTYSSSSNFGWVGENFWTPANSITISIIVGHFFPFKCTHLFARLAIAMTLSLLQTLLTWVSSISKRQFSFNEWTKYVDRFWPSCEHVEETGFSPIKISIRTRQNYKHHSFL